MMNPAPWSDVPHKNRTALLDFQGYHLIHHRVTGDVIARLGRALTAYPIGDGVGTPAWQAAHQRQHESEDSALGIPGPPLMTDYNFADPIQFASWMFVHAQETQRQMAAAGII